VLWSYQSWLSPPGPAKRVSGLSSPQVLERIQRTKVVQQEAEGELAVLVDHAVILGIGWPEIALRLGVTRQAARQHYQRRHRRERVSATQQNRSN
jgi:hypothetical protein